MFNKLFNFKGNIPAMGKNVFEKALIENRVQAISYNEIRKAYVLETVNYITHNDQWQEGYYNFHKVDVDTGHGFNVIIKTRIYTVIYYGSCNYEQKYFVIENTPGQKKKIVKDLNVFNPDYKIRCLTYHEYKWDTELKENMVKLYEDKKAANDADDYFVVKSENIIQMLLDAFTMNKHKIIREQEDRKQNQLTEEEKQAVIERLKKTIPTAIVDSAYTSMNHPYATELEYHKDKLVRMKENYQKLIVDRNQEDSLIAENKRRQLKEQLILINCMMADFTFKFDIADEGYCDFKVRAKFNFAMKSEKLQTNTLDFLKHLIVSHNWKKDLFTITDDIITTNNEVYEIRFTVNVKERNNILKQFKYLAGELQRGINFFHNSEFRIK